MPTNKQDDEDKIWNLQDVLKPEDYKKLLRFRDGRDMQARVREDRR